MKKTAEINKYDYTKMIKDFEADERFQNIKKRLKKKYQEENQKYLNGRRWNGKCKEYDRYGRLIFEGEYLNGKRH